LKELSGLNKQYHTIINLICDPNNRKALIDNTAIRLEKEKNELEAKKAVEIETGRLKLEDFRKRRNRLLIYIALGTLFPFIVFYLVNWILYGIIWLGTGVFISYVFYYNRRIKQKQLKQYRDDIASNLFMQIKDKDKEIDQYRLRMFVAANMINKFEIKENDLKNKYRFMLSYICYLETTYENLTSLKQTDPENRSPFIPIIKNKLLDAYFDAYADSLTSNIHFFRIFVDNTNLSDESKDNEQIEKYDEGIKRKLCDILLSEIADFEMSEYLTGKQYSFLEKPDQRTILSNLGGKSKVFTVHCKHDPKPDKKSFIHFLSDNTRNMWRTKVEPHLGFYGLEQIACSDRLVLTQIEELDLKDIER
jgi:hypothetical protein